MVIALCLSFTINVSADNLNEIKVEGKIDDDIYEMVKAYKGGTFTPSNESSSIEPRQLFSAFEINEEDGGNINYIYDLKQLDEDTYEATQIVIYTVLEKEEQGSQNDVILFCRIVYDKKPFFGNPWSYVMLIKIEGGVVQNNNNYWCEFLKMRYSVYGDAYNANGTRVGLKAASTAYGGAISPVVGTTYYIDGPSDYYYNMGASGSYISGWVRGTISRRLGNSTTLEVPCGIGAI